MGKSVDSVADAIKIVQKNYHDSYSERFGKLSGTLELDFYMLGSLALIFFILIFIAIKQKDTIQIN